LSGRGDRTGVNLAAPLQDGQQVIVPVRGSAGPASSPSTATPAQSNGPISLSQASEAQLETIDGIGPALAGRIIQYREAHGGFHSIDELKQVSGSATSASRPSARRFDLDLKASLLVASRWFSRPARRG